VGSTILQEADPRVRVEALLAVSELDGSSRAADAVAEVLFAPANARDRWMMDAAAIAGAAQGQGFVTTVLERRLPGDSLAVAGIARSVGMMTQHHAASADPGVVVPLVVAAAETDPALGAAMLEGVAEGWPEEAPPTLTPEQRTRLQAAAGAAPALAEGFSAVATRWGLGEGFRDGG
jgi:hypothetical protein